MALVFIGLGSNLGDGRQNLQKAWQRLGALSGVISLSLSSPYLSEPVGMDSEHWFTNAVGVLKTRLSPEELLDSMLQIEQGMGRDRSAGKDRSIDLDILYYDDIVCHTSVLELPHPELHNRLFVLAPMVELSPDHLHPVRQETTAQMRRQCGPDQIIKQSTW